VIGLCFIPRFGIEVDEALIASSGAYPHAGLAQQVTVFGHSVPLMIMSYVGALKSWIYMPIFGVFTPSTLSLRLPVLTLGGLTIWAFYQLVLLIAGPRAAIIGCVLLASDPSFLLTTCFDWGPVALQHLLLVLGILSLIRFYIDDRALSLCLGFFLIGLALWDKAIAEWMVSGAFVAALVVFPKQLRNRISVRNLALALSSLCVGALPLIVYNISVPFVTLKANAAYSSDHFLGKLVQLDRTLNGEDLFGYLTAPDVPPVVGVGENSLERFSLGLSEFTHRPRQGFGSYALLIAIAAIPFIWKTSVGRPMLFALITASIAWLQMAFTKGAGTSAHHVILLWPLPMLLVACALSAGSKKMGGAGGIVFVVVLALLVSSNALVLNEYLATTVRSGTGLVWTDAIFPLSERLQAVRSQPVYINDWGIFESVQMLNRGQGLLGLGFDPLEKPILDAEDEVILIARIKDPTAVFVSHTDEDEMFKGLNARFVRLATLNGYSRQAMFAVSDRNGRKRFDVFRFTADLDSGR